MSKFSRGQSAWKEHRLADELVLDGVAYTVKLLGRRGTGVQGYRVTVHFIPPEGGKEVEVALPNAASTADLFRIGRDLEGNRERLFELYRQANHP